MAFLRFECGSKNATYAYVSVRKAGGEWQAEGRETYPRMEQAVAVIPVICRHQSGLMETGLPWVMALLPMPRYQQLSGPSAGQLGAAPPHLPSRHNHPSATITHSAVCPEQGRRLCACSRWVLKHWDVVIRFCWTVGSVFLHFNICSVPVKKRKIFIIMNKHSKKPPILSPKEFSFTVEHQRDAPSSGGCFPEGSSICLLYLVMFLASLGWQSRLKTRLLAWET